jgi:hypothetical protein
VALDRDFVVGVDSPHEEKDLDGLQEAAERIRPEVARSGSLVRLPANLGDAALARGSGVHRPGPRVENARPAPPQDPDPDGVYLLTVSGRTREITGWRNLQRAVLALPKDSRWAVEQKEVP